MKKPSVKKIMPYAIAAALLFCCGWCFYSLCRIYPPFSWIAYLTPRQKLDIMRVCVLPNLICGILVLLWEAMDAERHLSRVSVILTFGFALTPLASVALMQLEDISVASVQSTAVGLPVICFLAVFLMRDIISRPVSVTLRRIGTAVLLTLLCGIWAFALYLIVRRSVISLWIFSAFALVPTGILLALLTCMMHSPRRHAWVIRSALILCGASLPIYLCIQPYDTTGYVSLSIFGTLLGAGILCGTVWLLIRMKETADARRR